MKQFLPISRADMQAQGIEQLDFVYVIGDAYVDHPSFGHAIISRILQANGFSVGIISQPDWKNPDSISILGEPKIGFIVTGGNMDSMVNHYSVSKKRRQKGCVYAGRNHGQTAGLRNRGILQSHPPHLQTHTADHWRTWKPACAVWDIMITGQIR